MAKGQKKSNRETRKPKQEKPKPASTSGSLFAVDRPASASTGGPKRG
jgi:hypothetical protein